MDARFEELQFELHNTIASEMSVAGAREVLSLLKQMNDIILRQMPRSRVAYVRDIVSALEGGAELLVMWDDEEKQINQQRMDRAMTGMPL